MSWVSRISVIPSGAAVCAVREPSALLTITLNPFNSAPLSLPSPLVSNRERRAVRSSPAVLSHSVNTYSRSSLIVPEPSAS